MSQWRIKNLGEVCTINIGKTPHRGTAKYWDKNKKSNNVWLSIADLKPSTNFIADDSKEYISEEGAGICKIVSAGTLMVSFKLTIGRLAFAGRDLFTNEAIASLVINDKNEILNQYLYWYLTFFDWVKASEKDHKVKGKTLNKEKLKAIVVLIPPLPEQKRIVAILDKAFEGIDTAIANTEKNLANARELFESYLKSVFLENNWETKSLNEISVNLDKKRVPITKGKRVSGNIPYYGASGIVDYVKDYIFDGNYLLVSEDGANLIARTYPIAFSVSGKSWVNNHAHILEFKDSASQKFIEFYLNSIPLEPYISGMAQPKLNQKKLNEIPIPYPDKATRENIVKKAGVLKDQSRSLENVYQQKLTALSELKQSLLNKAFSGELTTIKDDELRTEAVA